MAAGSLLRILAIFSTCTRVCCSLSNSKRGLRIENPLTAACHCFSSTDTKSLVETAQLSVSRVWSCFTIGLCVRRRFPASRAIMASNPRCQRQQSAASANESFFPESRRLTRPSRFSNMRPKRSNRFPLGFQLLQPYDIAYSDTVALNLEAPVAFNLEIGRGNTPTAACTEMPSRDRGRPKGLSAVDAHGGKMATDRRAAVAEQKHRAIEARQAGAELRHLEMPLRVHRRPAAGGS